MGAGFGDVSGISLHVRPRHWRNRDAVEALSQHEFLIEVDAFAVI